MADLYFPQINAEADDFSLINASIFDNDFPLPPSSEANTVDSQSDVVPEEAQVGKPPDLVPSQRPRKTGKCNLRKSLAWDSAFFTSDGVLDAEELTSILEGSETGSERNLLSIQEDLSRSTDSISTFQSDNLTLESLEADLFSDIRASIQRSSRSSPAGSNKGDGESPNSHSMKKVQASSGSNVKSKSSSKKIDGQGPVRLLKPGSISKPPTKPAVRSREASSSLPRPPAATGKSSLGGAPLPKRMSVSSSQVKLEMNDSGNMKGATKGASIPKVPRPAESRTTLQKTSASSRLPSASSRSTLQKTAAPSRIPSASSRNTLQKTSASSRLPSASASSVLNKSSIRSSKSSLESSCSSSSDIRKSLPAVGRMIKKNVRTPSRVLVESNSRTAESQLSAYVKSAPKLSPSTSPASSISEWSTETSSSTATVNQKPSGPKHSPGDKAAVPDSNLSQSTQKLSKDGSPKGRDNQAASMPGQPAKKSPAGNATSQVHPASAKPSGLRLPSPKIDFFHIDGVKATTKTPSGRARDWAPLPGGSLARPRAA